jgi:hypothetical protein
LAQNRCKTASGSVLLDLRLRSSWATQPTQN